MGFGIWAYSSLGFGCWDFRFVLGLRFQAVAYGASNINIKLEQLISTFYDSDCKHGVRIGLVLGAS